MELNSPMVVAAIPTPRHGAELMGWIKEAEDAEVGRIMNLSHAELVAEARARGEDPAEIVAEVSEIIQRAKTEAYRRAKFL